MFLFSLLYKPWAQDEGVMPNINTQLNTFTLKISDYIRMP